jgi:hypothetical protein
MCHSTSQIVVERQLNKFMQEFQDGKHEPSVITTQTVESLSMDEKQTWRAIRKELEDIGISVAAFDANKDFIMEWFKTAISTGAFEEQTIEDGCSSILCEGDLDQSLEEPQHTAASQYITLGIYQPSSKSAAAVGPSKTEAQSTPTKITQKSLRPALALQRPFNFEGRQSHFKMPMRIHNPLPSSLACKSTYRTSYPSLY